MANFDPIKALANRTGHFPQAVGTLSHRHIHLSNMVVLELDSKSPNCHYPQIYTRINALILQQSEAQQPLLYMFGPGVLSIWGVAFLSCVLKAAH